MTLIDSHPVTPSDEIFDFLLSNPSPTQVLNMRPSAAAQKRLSYLLDKNKQATLMDAERAELEIAMQTEYFVRRLKIRAREKLAGNV